MRDNLEIAEGGIIAGVGATQEPDPKAELARLRSFTMWQALQAAAAHDPGRHALVAANDAGELQRLTYEELLSRVRDLSAGFASIGVRRGDRLVLWMTNTLEWVVSAFAAMRLGAAVVPVNTFLKPPEIKYFIQQSGARHLVMIDSFRKLNMPELLAEICPEAVAAKAPGFTFSPELPDLRNIVLFGRSGGDLACAHDLATLAAEAGPEAYALADRMEAEVRSTDLAMVKYTSGSTAFPKGVMLEQGGIVANGVLHARGMWVRTSDVYFSMMPFFHAGGSIYGLMTMLLNGGTLVFTEAFDAEIAADLIASEQASVVVTVLGAEIVQAALAKGLIFPSVRVGSAPDETSRKVLPNIASCFGAFGLTETYGPAALSSYRPGEPPSGRVMPGNEYRVVDPETGQDAPPGTPGEAWFRGNVARGYWNKPEESARAFDKDGWFHTEDLVTIDAEGCVTWLGRLKLMLKVGGENVSIEEIERVVASHEAVMDCCAVGVPDKRKGEAARIYVTLTPEQKLEEEELRAWLKPRLAHFKLPREILFIDRLPRLGSGKVDRVQIARWVKEEAA
ncbi:class I adenylate-forming enzyme family protein [Phenylobacterium sp. LjRoot225]|uniref:class I adenylate-forming enzyme family protein n=1 Tax=Phenylobacterium sp. LjRoot225 TaxID=3342285 RepID=UPI003ECC56D8